MLVHPLLQLQVLWLTPYESMAVSVILSILVTMLDEVLAEDLKAFDRWFKSEVSWQELCSEHIVAYTSDKGAHWVYTCIKGFDLAQFFALTLDVFNSLESLSDYGNDEWD